MDLLAPDTLLLLGALDVQVTNEITVIKLASVSSPDYTYDVTLSRAFHWISLRLDTGITAKPVIPAKRKLTDLKLDGVRVYAGRYIIPESFHDHHDLDLFKSVLDALVARADSLYPLLGVTR